MAAARILVAGIGNIFFGDDAFGVEVARRLMQRPQLEAVRVVDFGIRGLDLVYALLDEWAAVIMVDAVPGGERPGTLYLIEPDISALTAETESPAMMEGHGMHPEKVLRAAAGMGAKLQKVLVVGCQPAPFEDDGEMRMELSPAVAGAVAEAVKMVDGLVNDILQGV